MKSGWRYRHTPKWLKMWSRGGAGRKTGEVAERRDETYDQFGSQYVHTASQMTCPLLNISCTPSKDMCVEVGGLLSAEGNKAMECRTTECCWE